jgi:hypothetical protein
MRRWGIFILLVLILSLPAAALAQTTPVAESVVVNLWPEYDQPTMLVIYHVKLGAATALPANVTLSIPSTAGDPYNVASREADGQLYNLPYQRTVQGDYAQVTFTATSTEIQFEYYDPGLAKVGDRRNFTYEWQGDLEVQSMTIEVQQPKNASTMTISPSLGSGITGEGGLVYYTAVVGSVSAGTKFKVALTYEKADESLSASTLSPQPSEPITPTTPGRSVSLNTVLAWGLAVLGIILIVAVIVWFANSGRASQRGGPRQRHTARTRVPVTAPTEEDSVYCSQCGSRAMPGDTFCRKCGTQLRRE